MKLATARLLAASAPLLGATIGVLGMVTDPLGFQSGLGLYSPHAFALNVGYPLVEGVLPFVLVTGCSLMLLERRILREGVSS